MTHSVFKLYDFFPELSDLYFLLKPSLTTKTQVRIREFILGNELIKYLRKCDSNFLISRQIILGIKNHPREGWSSIPALNKRFNTFWPNEANENLCYTQLCGVFYINKILNGLHSFISVLISTLRQRNISINIILVKKV